MPIQRIPRYVLLLEELLKYTPHDHADFYNVSEGLQKLKEVAKLINESKRQNEEFQLLIDLHNKLKPKLKDFVEPHRRMIRDGELIAEGKKKQKKKRNCFLLSDMLLITKLDFDTKYLIRSQVHLATAEVEDFPLQVNGNPTMFRVSGSSSGIMLYAKTPEEKKLWMADLEKCIHALRRRTKIVQQVQDRLV